ncbi:protein IWS1 homolog isoform X2 [Hippocampus comes]|uniref:protein IWS1 homolog isoform X1 n=1 Tax=Hippocampus comes TaxID=109280 RepID=UPI00094E2266|nr:PREDICTED: protein IWS1 homolog isoform X1 [Hippocampus comes]XP_019729865.1 PREDICTED: protein IWS1 homolog isoform X2 [Hippocampus comes]
MDGEEDEFMSGSHSDDGGGTPVQDEHQTSDCEDSNKHHSGDEGSNDEDPSYNKRRYDSDSDNDVRRGGDSDSEAEVPGHHSDSDQGSDSEAEAPVPHNDQGSDSDVDAPVCHHDQGSDSEAEAPIRTNIQGSDSEAEAPVQRNVHGSDSEAEAPVPHNDQGSDSDVEAPVRHHDQGSDSEADAPVHRNVQGSDSEAERPKPVDSDDDDDSVGKHGMSVSEDEVPVKNSASDNEEREASSPVKHRGSSSDMEEGRSKTVAAQGDTDHEDTKAKAATDSDSDTETAAGSKAAAKDSTDESGVRQGESEERGRGKWKAVMRSDSEDDEGDGGDGRKKAANVVGSDGEAQATQKTSDNSHDDDDEQPVKRKKAILSDSEEDEETEKPAVKRSRAVSDDDNSDSDAESGGIDKSMAAKLRELGSDSGSDEDDRSKGAAENKDEKALFGSDSDDDDNQEEKMIADIFGESGDEEEEEFTGFNQEDLEGDKKEVKEKQKEMEDSDSDEGIRRGGQDTSFMSDFDIMLARKKAMSGKRRRHRDGGTFISDADDVVSAMIIKMNEAAEEDRTLNSAKKPALKKLTLLPQVVMHLKKQDLKETFIDSGVMSAIKEWISPLPDKSLPALRIREELLRVLQELPSVSQETLKHSGIGRAVMFLYKHPKESRSNKDLALKLINEWSRPIFGLTSNYKGMTREERQQRDLDQQMPQRRRLSSGGLTPRRDLEKQLTGEEKALRPGDPGFCARARVPMPSNKDYVVRPKWNVEMESSRGPVKKGMSRVDKQMRRFADIRRLTKPGHAVKISVEGNRMPL